jgi:tetratricopeptide (TPR) repeat protein
VRTLRHSALLVVSLACWSVASAGPLCAQSLDAAAAALAHGDYPKAEADYQALNTGSHALEAQLGLARLRFETGRYAEAARLAEAAGSGAQRVAGQTLRAEALLALGQHAEAERVLQAVVRRPGALRAHLRLGLLRLQQGQTDRARPDLMAVIDAYNADTLGEPRAEGLCLTAMAARALGSHHDANDTFREAGLADRNRVETQLEWAALFLDKYDRKHATESVDDALKQNPNHPLALTLKARLELERGLGFGEVDALLGRALATNPNLIPAHVTRAKLALRDMEIEAADAHLDRALQVNPRDLEALSVRAAARFLADDARGFEQAKRRVLELNPRFSRMFSIIAEYAEWEHRYDELIRMAREALVLDAEDALAHATLGLNLLRMGDEKAGIPALEAAWQRDHFNVLVFNTLNLYDEVIPKQYTEHAAGEFTLRTHRDEQVALEPYLGPMLEEAYAGMRARYGFTPKGPLRIELYADPQHFSVRTTGLPNVGVQGVCFGKVVTALSPRGGPFNWGQIVWHELAHIFHLQLSKNHVPRWFTEGLAEYETIVARTEWRREEDHNLWAARRAGQVPKLSQLNSAFTHAQNPQALMTAYYVASLGVQWLIDKHGFAVVPRMLQAWGEGRRTAEVVQSVLGVSLDALDRDFASALDARLLRYANEFDVDFAAYKELPALEARTQAHPDDAGAWSALALGQVLRGDWAAADLAGKRALKLDQGQALAHFALTRVALEQGDAQRAERCLKAIVKRGQDGYLLRMLLGRSAMAQQHWAVARAEAERATALDPERGEAWQLLLEVAQQLADRALALAALERIVALDQHDGAAHLALLALYVEGKNWQAALELGARAKFVEPASAELHRLLGRAELESGQPARALTKLDQALRLAPPKPGAVQLLRARALLALKKPGPAREAADAALAADRALRPEIERLFAH